MLDQCWTWVSTVGRPTRLINMSAAVLSLIEIILVAVSCTETFAPAGLNWSEPEPAGFPPLFSWFSTVSS